MIRVFPVRSPGIGRSRSRQIAKLEAHEHVLWFVAERQTKMIDERDRAVGSDLGVETQLGIGGPTLNQGPARIVADAAQHRGANAGGADDRVRLSSQRTQVLLQRVERGARKADDLPAVLEEVHAFEAHNADQDNWTIVVAAPRGRAACQAGIRRLENHRASSLDGAIQHAPHLDKRSRTNHCRNSTSAAAETARVPALASVRRQDMGSANNGAKELQQCSTRGWSA